MPNKYSKIAALTIICLLLGAMLAWQYKSINNNDKKTSYDNLRVEELKDELIILQGNYANLNERFDEIMKENEIMREKGADSDILREDLNKNLTRVRMFSGLLPVQGPGIIITIKEGSTFNIQDQDLLQLINELRAADAQAICINNERIVAMSEIRSVTSLYIMINGNRNTAPYVIKAIGEGEKMERSIKMPGGVIDDFVNYNFDVTVALEESLTIPAVKDDGSVIKTNLLGAVE